MVHRREVNGEVLIFGNQGALWGNAMTWFDHDTGTYAPGIGVGNSTLVGNYQMTPNSTLEIELAGTAAR